jgi:hypothetical protein
MAYTNRWEAFLMVESQVTSSVFDNYSGRWLVDPRLFFPFPSGLAPRIFFRIVVRTGQVPKVQSLV